MTPEEKKAAKAKAMKKWREKNRDAIKAYEQRPEVKERTRLASARYRAENPEKVAETNRRQYEKNAEELRDKALARYHANREVRSAYRKAFYRRNRTIELAYRKRYEAANSNVIREKARIYREANRERRAANIKRWRQANSESTRIHLHTRRARLSGGRLSTGIASKLMRLQRARCPDCKVNLKRTGYHIDHIEPLAKGGANEDHNVQLLCPTCNYRKSHKDPFEWAKQQGRLL